MINNPKECISAIKESGWLENRSKRPLVLGFDCEWVPNRGEKVALLQLSDGKINLLFRLLRDEPESGISSSTFRLPEILLELMSDLNILKVS